VQRWGKLNLNGLPHCKIVSRLLFAGIGTTWPLWPSQHSVDALSALSRQPRKLPDCRRPGGCAVGFFWDQDDGDGARCGLDTPELQSTLVGAAWRPIVESVHPMVQFRIGLVVDESHVRSAAKWSGFAIAVSKWLEDIGEPQQRYRRPTAL